MSGSDPFFGPGGTLEAAHPGYERRSGQSDMARAVRRTLRDGGLLMVEAGTGTGKTLAYLVPAIESGRRVIVSTGTKNLQDQIARIDIPFLKERAGMDVSTAVLKGRENYFCVYRFAEFEKRPLLEVADEARWIPRIAQWSRTTLEGDRSEIADLPDGLRLWRDVNARADTCLGSRCPEYESCWLVRAKRRAEDARIVVVNHHLFFADLAVRTAFGAVLPDYDTVVFDEAHLLEEIATRYFGLQVSSGQIQDLARDAEALAARTGGASIGGGGSGALRDAGASFFGEIRHHLRDAAGRVRFEPAGRGGPDLGLEWEALKEALAGVRDAAAAAASKAEEGESLERRAGELAESLSRVLARDDAAFVYGAEIRGRATVVLSASPVDVAALLRDSLFDALHAGVLTSATLAVEGTFDYFRGRLGLEDAETRIVDSPFDPERQALLYLPRHMPEPREPGFVPRVVEEVRGLLAASAGRAFVLFTSYANLERVRAEIERDGAWPLLVQGDGSKQALVERFKATPESVLLGTTSFWHGVDVPGDALSLVIVDKLPFGVPSDPLVAARIERIRRDGGRPFVDYQLPLAVLELKQGLGRLLRRRDDRGILAVLDPRIRTKRYGETFLASIPPYRIVHDLDACREFLGPSA